MKNIKHLTISVLLTVCVCLLGAWTPAQASSATTDRYADFDAYSLYSTETITFDTKDNDEKFYSAPQYTAMSGMINACGAVAGAEIIAYYDKYYANMIPDWQSYYPASGKYRPADKVHIPAVMNELYTLMRTNIDGNGVSDSDFIAGLKQYINGKGYSMSMQNAVSGTDIDFTACKTAINNNKVIALLSRAADVYKIVDGTTQDGISSITLPEQHIMVASGYKEVKYYKGGKLFRTDRYLIASSGLNSVGTVYYKVNPHSLNYAYIVNIA